MNQRKPRFLPAILVIILMAVLIGAYAAYICLSATPDDNVICQGVFIDKIDVGGMSKDKAVTVLSEHANQMGKRNLQVDVNGETVQTTLSDIGYRVEVMDAVEQALKVGKQGNIFSSYVEVKKVIKEKKVFPLVGSYSDKKVNKFVKNQCGKKCSNAQNAKIKMKNGVLTYTEAKPGVSIDVDTTVAAIKTALKEQKESQDILVTAQVKVQQPKVTKELAERCKDKLGTFTTSFNAANVSRSRNVANAARLIHGAVVYPGETFSVHDVISPMTEENGYYAAPSYSNGQVVDSIGGGVCQVSTTLYNAVLRAELEVVERSPHSMVVSYVKPSMDAAIAGDYKDFKFRNNTEVPLFIQGGTYAGNITFTVYGEETRSSSRTVSFESEVIEKTKPGQDKITYDKTKPESYSKVTQEAHIGYKAVLWKLVTVDGETERTQINSSTYKAEPRYIIKGAAKATPSPTPDANKENNRKKESSKAGNSKKTPLPNPTKQPEPTPEPASEPTSEPTSEPQVP